MQPITIAPRLAALRQRLAKENLDALLVVRESNVTYLSGYTNHEAFLFISGENHGAANIFITDFRYTEQAEEECPDYEIVLYKNSEPVFSRRVAELCEKYGVKRLGFEQPHISYHMHESVKADIGGVEFLPTTDLIEDQRKIKDAAEVERLKIACAGTDKVFADICKFIRPGLTEREVEWELLSSIHRHGFDQSFTCIVVSGARGSLPHGLASDKKLLEGEFITMDFGCMYLGYHADITRTVFLGRPEPEQRRFYEIVLAANLRAEAAVRGGVAGAAVDAAARDYITEAGYGKYFGHGLGHGVGLDIHERPFMNRVCAENLENNCFITVEPGIYLPAQAGVRIEDTVLVTENGCEVLFNSPKELICL